MIQSFRLRFAVPTPDNTQAIDQEVARINGRSLGQKAANLLFMPLRVLLDEDKVHRLGLITLRAERVALARRYCRGRILDVGCGHNDLARNYRNGYGGDYYRWSGIDMQLDAADLPFKREAFDTVVFLACINHIPHRQRALLEAWRVLRNDGMVLLSTLHPLVGLACHTMAWWDEDQVCRGIGEGEVYGVSGKALTNLLENAGFCRIRKVAFGFHLNHLYIASKAP